MRHAMLIDGVANETRIIVLRDGAALDLYIERTDHRSLVGNIYLGRIETISRGIGAAFVDIGEGRAGFLPLPADGAFTEGAAVMVQVSRDGYREKGPQLTCDVSIAGRFLVYSPQSVRCAVSKQITDETERDRLIGVLEDISEPESGLIARTVAAGAGEDVLRRELKALQRLWAGVEAEARNASPPYQIYRDLAPAVKAIRDHAPPDIEEILIQGGEAYKDAAEWCDAFAPEIAGALTAYRGQAPLFEERGQGDVFDQALERAVPLPSGGGIVIEATEALTVIDVNSGRFLGGGSPSENALKINLEAAAEICRQVRLRNIGGMIVIDFIRQDDDPAWDGVIDVLRDGFAENRVPARVLGRTEAGLVEIIRRRTRPPLAEYFLEECATCAGTGVRVRPEAKLFALISELRQTALGGPAGTIIIKASGDIGGQLAALYGDGAAMAAAAGIGRVIEWKVDPSLPGGEYQVLIDQP